MRRLITLLLLCLCLLPQSAKAQSVPTVTEIPTIQVAIAEQLPAMAESKLVAQTPLEPLRTVISNPCSGGCGYDAAPMQCTRWAAIIRERMGHPVGDNWHDARQWPSNAIAAGVPVGDTPIVAAVAVDETGAYGHAMVVTSVNADGSFLVTEANYDWAGSIRDRLVTGPAGLTFIYY